MAAAIGEREESEEEKDEDGTGGRAGGRAGGRDKRLQEDGGRAVR